MGNTSSTAANKSLSVEQLSQLSEQQQQSTTTTTTKQLSILYTQFIHRFPTGTIKREDLHSIFRNYFPFADDYSFVDYLFSVLDKNGDSVVDFEEFLFFYELLLQQGNEKVNRKELLKEYLFDGRDLNGIVTSYKKLTVGFISYNNNNNNNNNNNEDPLLIQEFLLDSITSTFSSSSSSQLQQQHQP